MLKKPDLSKLVYFVNYVGMLDAFYEATKVSLRLRGVARMMSACLVSASSAVEVKDHPHEVGLGLRVISIHNMSM